MSEQTKIIETVVGQMAAELNTTQLLLLASAFLGVAETKPHPTTDPSNPEVAASLVAGLAKGKLNDLITMYNIQV